VGVDDVDAVADRIVRLDGAVYVPPTNTNIGRISVVADPQTATLALVTGLKPGEQPAEPDEPGRVGWHELLASDWKKAFALAQDTSAGKADAEFGSTDRYQMFSVGEQTIGGMFTKRPLEPIPFWLYYFNVDDVDSAAERVTAAGGQIFEGPIGLPDGNWIVRCRDPEGTAFALQGNRSQDAIDRAPASELGWFARWDGYSSQGRLVITKPRSKEAK
jgi:predicted enzyme related to lactoylglutathione lyase